MQEQNEKKFIITHSKIVEVLKVVGKAPYETAFIAGDILRTLPELQEEKPKEKKEGK